MKLAIDELNWLELEIARSQTLSEGDKPEFRRHIAKAIAALQAPELQSETDELREIKITLTEHLIQDYGRSMQFLDDDEDKHCAKIADICVDFLARRLAESRPASVNTVVSREAIEGVLYDNSTDEADDGKWIEGKDYHKVSVMIHALQLLAPQPSQVSAEAVEELVQAFQTAGDVNGNPIHHRFDFDSARLGIQAVLAKLKGGA